MSVLQKLHPAPAWAWLRSRKRYQVWAMVISFVLVVAIFFGFIKDSKFLRPYKAEVMYFQSWPLDRSDAEIAKQRAIDDARIARLKAERDKKQKARQAEFQQIDNTLTGWGL